MKGIKIISLILSIIMLLSFVACKSTKSGTDKTSSENQNPEIIQYDITPNKPEVVVSAAADHKPDKGYEYNKEENVLPTDENTVADGFLLTTTDEESKETKNIVSVYHEQGDINVMELDVLTKDATDADIDAAVKLIRELMETSFEKFPMSDVEKHLPLSTAKIKTLISNNAQVSETVYGDDTAISITYDYFPTSGSLIFRIEY